MSRPLTRAASNGAWRWGERGNLEGERAEPNHQQPLHLPDSSRARKEAISMLLSLHVKQRDTARDGLPPVCRPGTLVLFVREGILPTKMVTFLVS